MHCVHHQRFNSIKVRLKESGKYQKQHCYSGFNSIKVRLKEDGGANSDVVAKFQFHKGAIKSLLLEAEGVVFAGFQFHKGAIKRRLELQLRAFVVGFNSIKVRLKAAMRLLSFSMSSRCFNSIKVRLKDQRAWELHGRVVEFQFHKGAIKRFRARAWGREWNRFNSIKVRLKAFTY